MLKRFSLLQLCYTLLFLLSALWLAWMAMAQTQFLYGLNYDLLDIDAHIERYAPQNRHRKHFEHTDKAQHMALFEQVCIGIRHDARRLETIRYTATVPRLASSYEATLLHRQEIVHLTDVYRLVSSGERAGLIVFTIWLLMTVVLIKRKFPFFNRQAILSLSAFVASVCVLVLVIGPIKVFYWLHKAIFPPENPWFFYYQDSLMTTFMKAPDLFIAIGVEWLLITVALMSVGIVALRRLS